MKTQLVIFGITGDLSKRKVLPALAEIISTGEYEDVAIIGVSRRDVDIAALLKDAQSSSLEDRTSIFTMDLAKADDYIHLKETLTLDEGTQVLVYLSVPPSASADIVEFLGQAGLNGSNVKILFEKPFGFDLYSAENFIARTGKYFEDDQLYRIDHYMAKEIAQEIVRLRSNAENKHHAWDNTHVKAVEVVASETLGVADRAVFYEQTGALRDFIQGHLLQLLSLVLMDIPYGFGLEHLPEQRLKALEQLETADPEKALRAQYEGYQEDVGNIGSTTETFVHLELVSSDPRWKDVPLTLTTGKKLHDKRSYVTVSYTDGTRDTFDEGDIRSDMKLPDAYERVLVEAIAGRKSIFTTSPEVLQSWQILAPIQQAWEMDTQPQKIYPVGSTVSDLLA